MKTYVGYPTLNETVELYIKSQCEDGRCIEDVEFNLKRCVNVRVQRYKELILEDIKALKENRDKGDLLHAISFE